MHSLHPFPRVPLQKVESKTSIVWCNCNTPCRDNNDKDYGIQYGLKKDFNPRVDILATYL